MSVKQMSKAVDAPTPAEIINRARALIPVLKERAEADERARMVSRQTVEEMKEAGLFRVLQAKRWGGYEMDPDVFSEVQIALAEGDMSAAWIYGVIGVHAYHLCLFDDQAAQDVWSEDSSVLISSPYMPGGVAKRVPGGFEFSGRWAYSSGSDHCPWTFLGGFVEGDPTDYRSFLLPRKDCKFVDTWHTLGLAATGSHDITVEKAFVPEHRTHKFIDGFTGQNPGLAFNDGPIFRMPFMQVFLRAITASQIGALQALLELFMKYASTKKSDGKPLSESPESLLLVAEARAAIWEMKSTIRSVFATLQSYVAKGTFPSMEERLLFRHMSAEVADRCVRIADEIVQATGGGLVYDSSGFNRIYRNMQTGRQHVCAQYRPYARKLGAHMFGQQVEEILI